MQPYLPIPHVRDSLVQPQDRLVQTMLPQQVCYSGCIHVKSVAETVSADLAVWAHISVIVIFFLFLLEGRKLRRSGSVL